MIRFSLLLVCTILVGCGGFKATRFDYYRPGFQFLPSHGVHGDIWQECAEQIRQRLEPDKEVAKLTDAELDCLIHKLMYECGKRLAVKQRAEQGPLARAFLNEWAAPDNGGVFEREMGERWDELCGPDSGGTHTLNVQRIFVRVLGEKADVWPEVDALVCPVPAR
jgi:hypothetical protein